jgi:hypothetical protein
MQLWHVRATTSLQIFCCSAAYFSGSAAQIFVEFMEKFKNKPCRGEIFDNVLQMAMFKLFINILHETKAS